MYSCSSLTEDTEVRRAVCLCHRPELQALSRRIDADLSRRGFVAGMAASVAALGLPFRVQAQTPAASKTGAILFTNVRLFDGGSATLRDGHLLVEGDRIQIGRASCRERVL